MTQKFLSGYLSKRMKTYAHTETSAQMFIADLFIITWKIENNYLPTCGWINKWWLIHKWSVAAKLLQSFPTMRPHRWQPTRLPHPWDSPGKNTGVGCHFFLQCMKVKVKSLSSVQLLATPWTAAHQSPPSMGFSRQEHWSGVPLPSPNYCPRSSEFSFPG